MAKKLYTLGKDFWNGAKLQKRGELAYFEEGQAPKTAVLAPTPAPEPKPAPTETKK
jgi:hypothetical protein